MKNRNWLEGAADFATGNSYKKTAEANLEEAKKRQERVERTARIYKREGEYANLSPAEALAEGKKSGKEEYTASTAGNARVIELAETSAHRAEIGSKVAGAVQDINAGLAYTGGTILG